MFRIPWLPLAGWVDNMSYKELEVGYQGLRAASFYIGDESDQGGAASVRRAGNLGLGGTLPTTYDYVYTSAHSPTRTTHPNCPICLRGVSPLTLILRLIYNLLFSKIFSFLCQFWLSFYTFLVSTVLFLARVSCYVSLSFLLTDPVGQSILGTSLW